MQTRKRKVFNNILASALVVLIFFFGFIILINTLYSSIYLKTQVRGYSMLPTLNTNVEDEKQKGDTIYVNKYTSFTNNDIVVAKVDWYDQYIIKRVVGTPGDKVEIKDETTHFAVYVNDKVLYTMKKTGNDFTFPRQGSIGYFADYQDFLNKSNHQCVHTEEETGNKYILLKNNEYFLMGDNWGHTTDSITHGPVKKQEIVGKVDCVIDYSNKNPFEMTWFFLKETFSKN